MKRQFVYSALLTILMLMMSAGVKADAIDSLREALMERPQIQERIFVQTDNDCYYVGDTLWYKAFVLRADSLLPTDMSKLLYVELLTPDGYLVARNRHVIASDGTSHGQFFLEDSIYSGYYEVRAYTKWQLNFNETTHPYSKMNRSGNAFYSKELREAYFRDYEGLYSRVLPVYEKPLTAGDFADKRIIPRPKQRVYEDKPKLKVTFYPEGGHLIEGLDSRVAFEVTDNDGQGLALTGVFNNGFAIRSGEDGRGVFNYKATSKYGKVKFQYEGKDVSFHLPDVQKKGCTLTYNHVKRVVTAQTAGVKLAAVGISCRGRLCHFERVSAETYSLDLSELSLPTGINEIIVYDADAQPLASRLFFVDNHDKGRTLTYELKDSDRIIADTIRASAYGRLDLQLCSDAGMPRTFCVAVRDNDVEELSYDDGNIMTDFLLTGELKGFVANPAQYFPKRQELKDVAERRLDLLMMVQGWRRYKRVAQLRYLPETNFVFEGQVLNVPDNACIIDGSRIYSQSIEEMGDFYVSSLVGYKPCKIHQSLADMIANKGKMLTDLKLDQCECQGKYHSEETAHAPVVVSKKRGKEVVVEAELIKDTDVAAVTTGIEWDGSFKINLPPFYDQAVLMLTAYQNRDSLKRAMTSSKNKRRMDETSFPDYYVKQNMFFPMFVQPYSWYQCNAPDDYEYVDAEDVSAALRNEKIEGDHYLANVTVRKRRRSKHAIRWDKPAICIDAYRLYNEMTDYGLSHGVLDMTKFTIQATTYLFGFLDESNAVKMRCIVGVPNEGGDEDSPKRHTAFFRNYVKDVDTEYDYPISSNALLERLRLKRIKNILAYTDYDKRSGDLLETDGGAAVTLVLEPFPDNGAQYTYRDRRYILDGFTYAEDFYNPDYSNAKPSAPTDYRRTLYWNPDARPSADGTFHVSFYNNSRPTSIKVTAAGIDSSGNFYYTE